MARLRSPGGTLLTTRPPMLTVPPPSGSRPAIRRRTVLLPQPLRPPITSSTPLRTCRVRSETAVLPSVNTRETSSSRTSAIPLQPPPDLCLDHGRARLPAEGARRPLGGGHRVAALGLGASRFFPVLRRRGDLAPPAGTT